MKELLTTFLMFTCLVIQAQVHEWSVTPQNKKTSSGRDVVTDSIGNTYTCGTFQDTLVLDSLNANGTLISNGNTDLFFAKYNSSGQLVFAKSIGGIKDEYTGSINTDAKGNIYICGTFDGTVDFDPNAGSDSLTSSGGKDAFWAKYDSTGSYIWAMNIGFYTPAAWAFNGAGDVAVNSLGEIYVTGSYYGTVDFDPGPDTAFLYCPSSYSSFIFLAKYDPAGNYIWAHSFGQF